MTPASRKKPATTKPRRFPGLKSLAVALFLTIQAFLVLHQLEHGFRPDLSGPPDDCVLCQVSANLLPATEPVVVTVPVIIVDRPNTAPVAQTFAADRPVTGFRSRAPPLPVFA